ncbi:MAG TPA: DEDD exonuclease domain-containing protein [Candidatus Nanopelagicaceae bacterium]
MTAPVKNEPWQASFEDLGRALSHTTFVVIDLETSGGSPGAGAGITEIGAVKVRGGEVIGEFHTLINPGTGIPPFITVLTGITDAMVIAAPSIAETFPTLLEFIGSEKETVMVAHNAPFDIGFLKAAAAAHNYGWPKYPVVDTARLARQVLTKEEVPNCKLRTLSLFFRATTSPTHRALDDARATVDVLHGIFDRLGSFGVTTLEELTSFSTRITAAQRGKKHLAANIPAAPGVYIFRGPKNEILYVGTSRNLKSRVRTYFTAGETRKRIHEMVALTDHIDVIVCATIIEAQVRELRMINEHKPHYNQRSRFQEKAIWIKRVHKPVIKFSLVRGSSSLHDHDTWIGPFGSRIEAELAINAIAHALASPEEYQDSNIHLIVSHLTGRMQDLSLTEQYEEAAHVRNQLASLLRGLSRGQKIRGISRIPQLVIASPTSDGWEFICIRYGRLAGSALSRNGVGIHQTIESLTLTAEIVIDDGSILPASSHEEVEKLLSYLNNSEIRIVSIDGEWSSPIYSATAARERLEKLIDRDHEVANF